MYVRVAGWQTPREIIEEGTKVLFEVAETDGCSICLSRIEHVKRTLREKGLHAEFSVRPSSYGPCLYVILDAPPAGADLKGYVGGALRLSLS